jgi:Resolvase, N terminal domain
MTSKCSERAYCGAAGCDVVHEDRLSGVVANRPGLNAALDACQSGDVLHVWKLDRLGKVLTGEGAAIDTTRPEGRLILGVFAASWLLVALAIVNSCHRQAGRLLLCLYSR